MKTAQRMVFSAVAALGLCAALLGATVVSADTVSDDFSSASIDGSKWFLPGYSRDGGQMVQAGGKLSFTGVVSSSAQPRAGLTSMGLGEQTGSWWVEVDASLQGGSQPFPGMGSNDGVFLALFVEPGNFSTGINDAHGCELDLGFVDLTAFGGSGFGHALRQRVLINNASSETIQGLGNSDWRTLRFRMDYDAVQQKLSSLYDAGSGFVSFGAVVDTSAWNMAAGDYFFISIAGGTMTLDGAPPSTSYTVAAGQAYFDNYNANGVTVIPEPAFGAPMALLALALIRATANRYRRR